MKLLKKLASMIVLCTLLCMVMLSGACGNKEESGDKTYTVTVKDGFGNSYESGVIVQFLKDGSQVAMQVCDANGVATKTLAADEYDIALKFTEGEEGYYYKKDGLKVTADKTDLEVILSKAVTGEAGTLYVGEGECAAYALETGCTYVELEKDIRNYFLFTPTETGTYEFSVVEGSATIGYYGAPHFVQSLSAVEVVDNKFTISVNDGMISSDGGTATLVIGVDSVDGSENCVIGLERIGEPKYSIADEPWTVYEKTVELSAYVLPEELEIHEFDITAESDAYNLVFNEADGFYHLDSEDGDLVLVHLTKDPSYVACYKTILENTGVVKYFFDENGDFEKKESYSQCLLEYIEHADEDSGLYPLTKDLAYIIQENGDHLGWWDIDGATYIFVNELGNDITGVNPDIAWLFMCCYASSK